MKKLFLFLSFIFFIRCAVVNAQVFQGGFGDASCGTVFNFGPQLQKLLTDKNAAGPSLQLNAATFDWGGNGYTLKPRGFILGGSGYFYRLYSGGENGKVKLGQSAGFFTIGYLVLNKKKWIGFPYGGFGAFGSAFRLSNSTPDKILTIERDSITNGNSVSYSTGGFAFDMGFGLKYFVFDKQNKKEKNIKGMIGLDGGISFFPAFMKWENTETHVQLQSIGVPFSMCAYCRITIGMGVFYGEEKRE